MFPDVKAKFAGFNVIQYNWTIGTFGLFLEVGKL